MASIIAYFVTSPTSSPSRKALANFKQGCSRRRDEDFRDILQSLLQRNIAGGCLHEPSNFIPQCLRELRVEERGSEQKSVSGKITSINEHYGLVDHFIYFETAIVSSFLSDDLPAVGDRVRADVQRRQGGGWIALKVVTVDDDGCAEFISLIGTGDATHAIGCVSEVCEASFTVEQGCTFKLERTSDGFIPCVGDWVKVELTRDRHPTVIAPLRTKKISGTVTAPPRRGGVCHEPRGGKINGDIWFTFESCIGGYIPRRNDEVLATAIESRQGHCSWRAAYVELVRRGSCRDTGVQGFSPSAWVLRGGFPNCHGARPSIPSFLPKYVIPENVKHGMIKGTDVLNILPSLKNRLCMENYADRFSALVYLEEISAEMEIRRYTIRSECMERRGQYLCLSVPGIADGKPELSVGDLVVLHETGNNKLSMEYHGFIHHVILDNECILLKFHPEFQENFDPSQKYDVEFKYSRVPFRRCHFAVRLAQRRAWSNILFPSKVQKTVVQLAQTPQGLNDLKSELEKRNSFQFFDQKLNSRQKEAILRIIRAEAKSHPYILFGPPGTGKTVTLVEVILQLYFLLPCSRILVCAPSNSAVDLICERISASGRVNESDMVRFNAIRRLKSSVPDKITKFCRGEEEIQVTSRYRIILTTCMNSGLFYGLQLPRDHFTHVCIDEAGQSTEPETLIPLGLQTDAQVVMAGDPEQLGPVVMSPLASAYGLNESLLERLMKLKIYQRSGEFIEGYNPLLVTKLTNNYRSHMKLVELPSRLFYVDELKPCKKTSEYPNLLNWGHLPRKGFPIIFHGIFGQELRESDSPSLMNPAEIIQVTRYIKVLIRDEQVKTSDIGVVTPYRKQVEKIRMMLKGVNINGVKVGSVEEFQGQERSVIIVSTVRSCQENKAAQRTTRATLGFLANYKRFNVAISRAKDLMIIVGNPELLKLDKNWNALYLYTVENGGYRC